MKAACSSEALTVIYHSKKASNNRKLNFYVVFVTENIVPKTFNSYNKQLIKQFFLSFRKGN